MNNDLSRNALIASSGRHLGPIRNSSLNRCNVRERPGAVYPLSARRLFHLALPDVRIRRIPYSHELRLAIHYEGYGRSAWCVFIHIRPHVYWTCMCSVAWIDSPLTTLYFSLDAQSPGRFYLSCVPEYLIHLCVLSVDHLGIAAQDGALEVYEPDRAMGRMQQDVSAMHVSVDDTSLMKPVVSVADAVVQDIGEHCRS